MMSEDFSFEIQFFENLYKRDTREIRVIEILGHLYTKEGQLDDGLRMDRRLVRLKPEDPLAHYNLACSLALKDRKRDAVKSLQAAIDLGYSDLDWLQSDPDLKDLHGYEAYQDLVAQLE